MNPIRNAVRAVLARSGPRNRERLYELALAAMGEAERDAFVERNNLLSEATTYRRLARLGFQPSAIIDVGAYKGEWAMMAHEIWPRAHVTMIEASADKALPLQDIARRIRGDYVMALVGRENAERSFWEMESGSSMYREQSTHADAATVTTKRVSTLDSLSSRCDFLKLDVQGAELDVLAGAARCLREAHAVQLEAQLIPINEGAPRLDETIAFMADNGFAAYDVFSPWRRPKDGALWSIDILFLQKMSHLVGGPSYD